MRAFLIAVALGCTLGCGRPEPNLIGVYFAEPKDRAAWKKSDPAAYEMAFGILGRMSLDLRSDHTYLVKIDIPMSPKDTPTTSEGTWRVQGSILILAPDPAKNGLEMDKDSLNWKILDDGSTLETIGSDSAKVVRFVRQKPGAKLPTL